MNWKGYTLPLLVSLVLHALVFSLVFSAWQGRSEPRETRRPQVVQAKVVEFTPKSQRQAEEEAAQQRVIDMRERQREREQQEAERQRQQAERQRQQEQERRAREEREREAREQERREQAERERREAEEQRRREAEAQREREERQRQLDQALNEEEEFFQEQQAKEVAQSYTGVIAQRIGDNWSRPPSARSGMRCVLEIQLVPNGEVVDVTVVDSSGNNAFDRSAEQAVKRVDRFEEVQDMPSQVFERHFRRLRLEFNPEDLRL